MSSLPDPCISVEPIVRHGTARIYLGISECLYSLSRFATATPAWKLTKQTGERQGTSYICGLNEHGQNACSCPDHQQRGAHCKHLGALVGAGMLPATNRTAQPQPSATELEQRERAARAYGDKVAGRDTAAARNTSPPADTRSDQAHRNGQVHDKAITTTPAEVRAAAARTQARRARKAVRP